MRKLQRRLCLALSPIAAALFLLAGPAASAFGAESTAGSPPIETVEAPSGATETSSPGWTTEGGAAATPAAPPVRQGSSVGSGGGAPQKAPSTSTPPASPAPAPAPTPAPTSEAPSYPSEPSEPTYSAPEPSSPAPVEQSAPAASPAPVPVEKPEPAPAPAPEPAGKADLAGATALTHSSPPVAKADSEAPAAGAPRPSGGDEGGSSWVTPLLIILALCILVLATVQLRRYLRYREIEAVKRERAEAWDAAVHQMAARRPLAVEPSAKGLHAVETPDRPTHLAA